MNMGSAGISQSASNQSLHSQNNLNDSMVTGLPPTSLMQNQMSNGMLSEKYYIKDETV